MEEPVEKEEQGVKNNGADMGAPEEGGVARRQ